MTDLFASLAADPVAEPAAQPDPKSEPIHPPATGTASFTCICGFADEVREPCPETIPCLMCNRTAHRWTPKFAPPRGAGRVWQ